MYPPLIPVLNYWIIIIVLMNCSECDLMWLYMYSACIMWGIREQQFWLLLLLYTFTLSGYMLLVWMKMFLFLDLINKNVEWIFFNPLSPSIHIQILQTDLHTFPWWMSRENLMIFYRSRHFLLGDHFINSHQLSLDNVWILSGEKWSWSLLVLKGLSDCFILFCTS